MGDVIHIIDSCSAAAAMRHEVGEQVHRGHVYSTHWSVVDYLSAHDIKCIDISSYTNDADLRGLMLGTCDDLKAILAPLDKAVAPEICRLAGIPAMPLFDIIYRYHGHYNLTGLRLFSHWLESELVKHDVVTVHYWHTREAADHPIFSFSRILQQATSRHSAGLIDHVVSQRSTVAERWYKRIRRLALAPRRTLQRLASYREVHKKAVLGEGATLAVIFEPEKRLPELLEQSVDEILLWPRSGVREVEGVPAISTSRWAQAAHVARSAKAESAAPHNTNAKASTTPVQSEQAEHVDQADRADQAAMADQAGTAMPHAEDETAPLHMAATNTLQAVALSGIYEPDADVVRNLVLDDFAGRARELLEPAVYMQQVHRRHPVTIGVWSVPLIGTPSRLAAEVLMQCGVPVAGLQHGGCYLSQHLGEKHFLTDFTACTRFISYAADQQTFEEAYSEEERVAYGGERGPCAVLRGGNIDHVSPLIGTQPVDIVFPVTNAVDLFWTCRTGADRLARAQVDIMQAIDSRVDLTSIVKPFPHASRDSIAVSEAMEALTHSSVVQMGWRDFLERYKPLLAVIEFPSTPLYEALAYDIDIFLLADTTAPFTPHALNLLEKRVHIFYSAEELVAAVMRYTPEQSGSLRDNAFYNAYVNTEAALKNITVHLSEIIASRLK
ncbi:hypothetical protein [Oleidesulfovibrio sp.]|uniref:hypothetical protein n=1 Tax=Oleidesulfovibrio sp. TaxID=2909707 RepID=UPI003A8A9B9A